MTTRVRLPRSLAGRFAPLLLAAAACGEGAEDRTPRLSLLETLAGGDTVGYARALEPRPFLFPEDHGPHPEYRSEWWYLTGNLTDGGRSFGFQFTIFRSSLAPPGARLGVGERAAPGALAGSPDADTSSGAPPDRSAWATDQAYMGHFALADGEGGHFHAYERFARGGIGLAGAEADPFRVWIEDWALVGPAEGGDAFPMRLSASEGEVALTLRLEDRKGPVLQGEGGLSQKGPEPGNASYYYSHPRLDASGTVALGADTFAVSGEAWMDREWSTSALSEGQVGWDWFSLQLDDGWETMVYRLRRADGSADPFSHAVLIDPSGATVPLSWEAGEVTLEVLGSWRSPIDGTEYPSGWRLRVPARGWDLRIEPVLEDQELDLSFRYWEGMVRVSGAGEGGGDRSGHGYAELTGYVEGRSAP